jgi:cardiolipin synthase
MVRRAQLLRRPGRQRSPIPAPCVPGLRPGRDCLTLYTAGDPLYRAMLDAIGRARHRVWLETYIFADDTVGRWFAEALAEKARQGLDVRLHVDAAGSYFWSSRRLERYLRDHGVRLRWFHRFSWRWPLLYNRRNHRKLLVVDRDHAFLGGFNIHDECSQLLSGEQRWEDAHVRLERRRLVTQAARLFAALWRREQNAEPPDPTGQPSVLLPNQTRRHRHRIWCMFSDLLNTAEHSIDLVTPYFVPDARTQRKLEAAAGRGVAVRLLVPRTVDVHLVRAAGQAAYASLLAHGVRIFEYQPRLLHAKTAVFDGQWATVGTANLDYRSFFLNYELNLVSRDPALCAELADWFRQRLADAEEIQVRRWLQRHWGQRLSELVGWAVRRWL